MTGEPASRINGSFDSFKSLGIVKQPTTTFGWGDLIIYQTVSFLAENVFMGSQHVDECYSTLK